MGHVLAEPELLFEKIEDSAVEAQIARLQETKRFNELNAPVEISPQKAETSFDDFSKMDLRVGKILEAETVPKANKLLKLLIDTGIDKRTIVSGIAEYYTDLLYDGGGTVTRWNPKRLYGNCTCLRKRESVALRSIRLRFLLILMT